METFKKEFLTDNGRTAHTKSGKWWLMHSMFETMFPSINAKVSRWGRYDQASIFLEVENRQTYLYSYRNDRDWCLQTKTNYLNSLGRNR